MNTLNHLPLRAPPRRNTILLTKKVINSVKVSDEYEVMINKELSTNYLNISYTAENLIYFYFHYKCITQKITTRG